MARLCDSIGIVGAGVVGQAIIRGMLEYCGEMRVYDIVPEKCTHSLQDTMKSDFVFVQVPTNASETGYDLTHLKSFFEKIRGHRGRVVLKSTVVPGTTDWLSKEYDIPSLMFSPEHLTARCALADFCSPARNIVGVADGGRMEDAHELRKLYRKRFHGVQCLLMTAKEAELSKLAINAMFGWKVLAFNHVYDICQKLGCSFEAVRQGILTDGRITHSHSEAVFDGKRGLYGYCLPKEGSAFAYLVEKCGVESGMAKAAVAYNDVLVRKSA